MKPKRIEWEEHRGGECGGCEVFFIIAERDDSDKTGWAFCERSSWDILWVRIPPTICRLVKALIEEVEQEYRVERARAIPELAQTDCPRWNRNGAGDRLWGYLKRRQAPFRSTSLPAVGCAPGGVLWFLRPDRRLAPRRHRPAKRVVPEPG